MATKLKFKPAHISRGKALVAKQDVLEKQQDGIQWEFGKLADEVETDYGNDALGAFAKKIGFKRAKCTLERWRDVYRDWAAANLAPGQISYSVQRVLQTHPDRVAIVAESPDINKPAAEELMQATGGTIRKRRRRGARTAR
jgi:hypothetical protein